MVEGANLNEHHTVTYAKYSFTLSHVTYGFFVKVNASLMEITFPLL